MELSTYIERLETLHGVQGNIARFTVDPSAKLLLKSIKDRIFKQGKNSNNQNIGEYDTKPIYVKRTQFASPGSFQPYGKRRAARLVTRRGTIYAEEKRNKTMYLPDGYKQLRQIQGKETQFVNLKYRGRTQKAYIMQPTDTGALLGLNTPIAALIRSGQEARFKSAIFSATQNEIQEYNKAVYFRIRRILTGITVDGMGLQSIVETPTENTLVDDGVY